MTMIPSFMQMRIADDNGNPTDEFFSFMQQLTQALQGAISEEGLKIPAQKAANITILNTEKSIPALLYDKDNKLLKVNLEGTFKTVQTS